MANTHELTSAQISQCGVLLTRYKLLLQGVESAPLTTDVGIDLVAYSGTAGRALTIQVKTVVKPTTARAKGRRALAWTMQRDGSAEIAALVDLSTGRVWLLTMKKFFELAQQQRPRNAQLLLFADVTVGSGGDQAGVDKFAEYLLEERVGVFF